ncbi:MAG: hypothetical protein ABSG16_20915 [Candidatus Acidiferrum sp.]|jgi:hypothetical protein
MKRLVPIPIEFQAQLKEAGETGLGYQVISVALKDGRHFDQVAASEGCVIEVRGCAAIPFAPGDVAAVKVNHKRWNFRSASDAPKKAKTVAA